jgi:hypothetical protein
MEINSKKLDELYKEWSGEHHTTNSNKKVHDSAECTDFAEYCLKWAVSEGEMIPTREEQLTIPVVIGSFSATTTVDRCGTADTHY